MGRSHAQDGVQRSSSNDAMLRDGEVVLWRPGMLKAYVTAALAHDAIALLLKKRNDALM